MTCDFDAGLELVSESEVAPFDNKPEAPPGWRGSLPSRLSNAFEALNSGMWHNRSPGETRIKIDYSRVISFFDPALTSLVEARAGKSREDFRLDEISKADTKYVLDQLTDIFTRDGQGSGIDWGSITQVIRSEERRVGKEC